MSLAGDGRAMAAAVAGSACLHLALLASPAGTPRPGGAVAAPPPAPAALQVALHTAAPRDGAPTATGPQGGRPGERGTPRPASAGPEEPVEAASPPPPVRAMVLRRAATGRPGRSGTPPARPAAARPPGAAGARSHAGKVRPPAREPVPHATRAPAATARAGTAAAAAAPRPATPGPRLEAALRLRLAEHFRYPPLARRRGWEGTVRLGLRIEPDGRLTRVRVLASSGHAVLDRAAARALVRIGRVPEAAGWLGGRPFDMVLPVEYRLVSR